MRILIATPIHQLKDYCMERWLESVSKLLKVSTADFLMVDNSPGTDYLKKIKSYCKKYGLTNYKLVHIDIDPRSTLDEKLAKSREVIRQEVLNNGYDAWFSWECDIIIPPNALIRLVDIIKNFWMISHAYPNRIDPTRINAELGITLIKRRVLEEFSFLHSYGHVDPLQPNCVYGSDVWFSTWMQRNHGEKYNHVYKIIKPIYHLNE